MFTVVLLSLVIVAVPSESANIDRDHVRSNESRVDIALDLTPNCTKHSDCNPVLRNLLHLINKDGESDLHRSRQETRAFHTLHRNPKIFCIHSQCRCSDLAQAFDPLEQICRQRCVSDLECSYPGVHLETPKGDPLLVRPDDDLDVVSQVCAADGLCRCPPLSELDALDQRRCIANTQPLLATSLTIGTIFILLTITVVPIWTMVNKQRAFNRQQQLLAERTKVMVSD